MENKLTLYDITGQFLNLLDTAIENMGELSDDQFLELEKVEGQFVTKAENYGKFIRSLETGVEIFQNEERRLADRRRAIQNLVKNLKERLKEAMIAVDTKELKAGTFSFRVQNNPPSLKIDDIMALPEYLREIKIEYIPKTDQIKEIFKNGESVSGCHIEVGTHLRIR